MTIREKLIKSILTLKDEELIIILSNTCIYEWFKLRKSKPKCDFNCDECWISKFNLNINGKNFTEEE
jgi:hypothetical protein